MYQYVVPGMYYLCVFIVCLVAIWEKTKVRASACCIEFEGVFIFSFFRVYVYIGYIFLVLFGLQVIHDGIQQPVVPFPCVLVVVQRIFLYLFSSMGTLFLFCLFLLPRAGFQGEKLLNNVIIKSRAVVAMAVAKKVPHDPFTL